MIDGIQITYHAPGHTHLTAFSCWEVTINEHTGEQVDDVRRASFRGMNMELKPAATGYRLTINGSLHKYYNGGNHNANEFPFTDLQYAVNSLSAAIGIEPANMELHGIEIGINVPLPFTPLRVLNNAVCYKNKPFRPIHKRNKRKGLICCLYDYDVKLYDKAEQSGIDCGYLLRIEVKVNKMRYLQGYGLATLEDLIALSKIYPLVQVLTHVLDSIIWTDSEVDLHRMNNREQKQWLYLSNPTSWEGMNKYQLRENRKKLTGLFARYVNSPVSSVIGPLLMDTWDRQFTEAVEAQNGPPFHRPFKNLEADQISTFSPLECIGEKVIEGEPILICPLTGFSIGDINNIKECAHINGAKNAQPPRYCASCGRDISDQSKHSRFCSERLYGQRAKQCRNKESNRRRDHKRTITSAIRMNRLVTISYRTNRAVIYSLHPSGIIVSRDWLDSVQEIKIK